MILSENNAAYTPGFAGPGKIYIYTYIYMLDTMLHYASFLLQR